MDQTEQTNLYHSTDCVPCDENPRILPQTKGAYGHAEASRQSDTTWAQIHEAPHDKNGPVTRTEGALIPAQEVSKSVLTREGAIEARYTARVPYSDYSSPCSRIMWHEIPYGRVDRLEM